MTTTTVTENNPFVTDFDRRETELNADLPRWVHRLRRGAIARFAASGLPTMRDEEWRFTNLASLKKTNFEPAGLPTDGRLHPVGLPRFDGPRLVLVNGHYCRNLSSVESTPDGLTVNGLAETLRTAPELVEPHLGRYASTEDYPLVALNTAFLADGVVIHVRPGVVVEHPIHVLHVSTAGPRPHVAHPRNLIVAGRHSQVTVVERYLGLEDNLYFNNAVTELVLDDGAIVDHYKIQQEGRRAVHVGTVQAQQGRGSTFCSHLVALGGELSRHETNTRLDAEGCHTELRGLYMPRGNQHVDSRTRIDHVSPHCTSHELYKGILDDEAHGVFNGKIFVHQDAQKTDAKQTNQVLLLSDGATINTKPQLEIFADDVKCTHGATVGQLDAEALFYLRSRGISRDHAHNLLIYAFAAEVLEQIRWEPLRLELEDLLLAGRGLPREIARERIA
jgi:Fe-S cluster assembly protein SufD